MKPVLNRGIYMMLALFFAVSSMTRGTAVSGMPMAVSGRQMTSPTDDITIYFYGLMVFEDCTSGTHPQMVRLHSGAANHIVSIWFKGPGYHHLTQWGSVYPKDATLKLEVWNDRGPLGNEVVWPRPEMRDKIPFNIRGLYAAGELRIDSSAFGPTFTLNRGSFVGDGPQPVKFVSYVSEKPPETVPTAVTGTINLADTGEVALLSGEHLPPGITLPTMRIRKPVMGEPKWEIHVFVEPTSEHSCLGYHFGEYYKGFGFATGPVPEALQYIAKPVVAAGTLDPCDPRPSADEIKKHKEVMNQRESAKQRFFVIDTRPCIPVGN